MNANLGKVVGESDRAQCCCDVKFVGKWHNTFIPQESLSDKVFYLANTHAKLILFGDKLELAVRQGHIK